MPVEHEYVSCSQQKVGMLQDSPCHGGSTYHPVGHAGCTVESPGFKTPHFNALQIYEVRSPGSRHETCGSKGTAPELKATIALAAVCWVSSEPWASRLPSRTSRAVALPCCGVTMAAILAWPCSGNCMLCMATGTKTGPANAAVHAISPATPAGAACYIIHHSAHVQLTSL